MTFTTEIVNTYIKSIAKRLRKDLIFICVIKELTKQIKHVKQDMFSKVYITRPANTRSVIFNDITSLRKNTTLIQYYFY